MKYWISYTDNTINTFEAKTSQEAKQYFMLEGNHAFDYGKEGDSIFCPFCTNGKLVLVKENYPYTIDHLMCDECTSTYILPLGLEIQLDE